MRTVYKYSLHGPSGCLEVGSNPKPVLFGRGPDGQVCLWVEVDSEAPPDFINYEVVPTGGKVPQSGNHFMSIVDEQFVWHLYIFL